MGCGEPCDGCIARATHHLCDSCVNADIDRLKKELQDARADVERLRGIVEVNDQRLAAVWDESRAEVEQLREIVKTAGDRLRACAHQMTEHAYQEMASVLFDLPASDEVAP